MRSLMNHVLLLGNRGGDGVIPGDPLVLPTSDQLFYYYAGDGINIPDTVATVGDGEAVTALADSSEAALDLVKAGDGTITYVKEIEYFFNRAGLRFDGNSYLWREITGILANLSVYTLYCVFRTTTTDQTNVPYAERRSSSTSPLVMLRPNTGAAGKINFLHRSDASVSASTATAATSQGANDGELKAITLRRTASNAFELRMNGIVLGTSSNAPGTTTVDRLGIGASISTSVDEHFTGDLALIAGYGADNYATVEPLIFGHYRIVPGAWSWYSDPRGVRSGDKTFVGSISKTGNIQVWEYNHATGARTAPTVLHAALEVDDHDCPALLVRASDSKLMAFYTTHNTDTEYYQRISTNALDSTAWEAETDIGASLEMDLYTYANPIQLTGEVNAPIYLFFRADPPGETGWAQYYSVSEDEGTTWASAVRWLANGRERPYIKFAANGSSRIDFAFTDGHPNSVATNSIYHGYYENGNLYQSDGTLVGALASGPYAPSNFTQLYNGATVRAWIHDIAIDADGYPRVVFATFPETTDHRYRYARWNGSEWSDAQICTAGTYLYAAEAYYSGGVVIDPTNVNTVIASRETGDGIHQIWQFTTGDGGASWNSGTQITDGERKAIRPAFVYGAASNPRLLYMTGTYTSYTSYATHIMLIDA